MKKTIFILAVALGFGLTSCDKDQKAVKNMSDGEWKITSFTEDGEDAFEDATWSGTASFEECKQKDGDCDGTMSITASTSSSYDDGQGGTIEYSSEVTFSTDFTYNTSNDGAQLNLTAVKSTIDQSWENNGDSGSESYVDNCGVVDAHEDEDDEDGDCTSTGTINDDYTKITITDSDGSVIVLEKE